MHTPSCDKGVFFFHSYLASSMTDWAKIFTGLLFYVEIHQLWRLVSRQLPMDPSCFPLSSAHRTREQETCTNTPNDILHDSAGRDKYTRAHDRVCPTTIIAVIGQMGERAQFDWQAGSVHSGPIEVLILQPCRLVDLFSSRLGKF